MKAPESGPSPMRAMKPVRVGKLLFQSISSMRAIAEALVHASARESDFARINGTLIVEIESVTKKVTHAMDFEIGLKLSKAHFLTVAHQSKK
ncbi:hypothetical protein HHL24_26760 [Paraburkholderia sp. RP-4-7]|uniref:Uncharacterized protein n=1 Tax=Paraburkholderia polaris TaxID=2728848 RepID=A0A848IKZ2_9BURK|nr:hypothetical protein [Paraburkholderia polaris]NMM01526.1 hypothetical protein [Paraburkholderia polaris]